MLEGRDTPWDASRSAARGMIHDMRSTMLLGSTSASTPGGAEWRITRRWITRGLPRWRKMKAGRATAEMFSTPDIGGPDDLVVTLAVILGAVVVAVIVIPLLLFGIELIALGLVVAAGIVGRGLLGRPWIVEARLVSDSRPAYTWQVSGWRRSARLIEEAAAAFAAGLEPLPAEARSMKP
jgi:hypothetical protein